MGSKSAIGIGNGICFKQVRDKGGGSYIDPLVRDSLVGVWIADQNTNESPTRNIIKNTIKDKGGDLELLNFGYKLNSGYGKYEVDFTSWAKYAGNFIIDNNKVSWSAISNVGLFIETLHLIVNENFKEDINSFKIYLESDTEVKYRYIDSNGISRDMLLNNGENTLPHSYVSVGANGTHIGFYALTRLGKTYTIKQLPLYEGALVTDGKDDLIASTKTVKEMLGGSNEVTVVSMVHQIGLSSRITINNVRSESVDHVVCRNICSSAGKTGIYGYSKQINTNDPPTLINNILGDKKDYIAEGNTALDPTDKFFVQGYKYIGTINEVSPIACYWTFIANKVLTTGQINQVISYFNLDKHVKPDIIYDTIRQGITNENHASFNDELTDFSGNGHNLKLYNLNWDKQSGIGSYPFSFKDYNYFSDRADVSVNKSNFVLTANFDSNNFLEINTKNTEVPSFKIKAEGIDTITNGRLAYRIAASDGSISAKYISEDGEYEIPGSPLTENVAYSGFYVSGGINDNVRVKVTIIPDYEGALASDGIDDYGKVENLPIYKDYTVVADREIIDGLAENADGGVAVRGTSISNGAFGFDYKNEVYSFATPNSKVIDVERFISYQSKYVNNGTNINAGNIVDANPLTIGKLGSSTDRYSKLALWSFLLFPYSLSEFLLERQLKRYKLGTLYPNMVEFRPVISGNIPYNAIEISQGPTTLYNKSINKTGIYLQEESIVRVYIQPSGIDEVSKITINGVEYTDLPINPNGYYYADFPITKSPQKISYSIDEYIRYEDIVHPYPAIINLKQDGKTITWGDKLKVGSEVTFVNHTNLLPDLYDVSGGVQYNGTYISWNISLRVEKSMVFVNVHIYKKANEPNCILLPNRLRIPNSSYKILGYIPDLTGKGNHGRLNNFAYAGMSGANGYVEDFTKWRISKSNIVSTISDSSIHFTHIGVNYEQTTAIFEAQATSNKKYNIKVRISGLTSNMRCFFNNTNEHSLQELVNGVNEISVGLIVGWYGFNINTLDGSVIGDCDITIQQIGEHEGSICFDGTDDHITISNIIGGKCIMAKVTVNRNSGIIYDQRRANVPNKSWMQLNPSSVIFEQNAVSTYIDGILNHNVTGLDLVSKTVNLTCELEIGDTSGTYQPTIGSSYAVGYTTNINLYEFMLFPDVPNEEEIKELNEVMGIEGGYVESPNYYYDAYGKKNTDTDRNLIADQVSKDVANALEVKNVAYNSESGYTDDNGLLLDGVEDHAINTVIPAVTDFTVIAKREFPESALVNNQTFLVKGDAINGNNNVNSLVMECYRSDNYVISFQHQNVIPLEESKISWATPTSYNGNVITKGSGVDSTGLAIGRLKELYRKVVFYKLMFYTKTIDQLSINMLKNLFERDELIDITNPIFKKKEL